ncbi:hypothetical protein [Erwinia amylovora]|uniref:hypothetical protein n=1 Tax=Erwinia amylovora TaxID=552 RepID=UPI001444361B|nr:hypothetical protein [Erwinia amylovora]
MAPLTATADSLVLANRLKRSPIIRDKNWLNNSETRMMRAAQKMSGKPQWSEPPEA